MLIGRTQRLTSGGYISPFKRGRRLVKPMVQQRAGADTIVCRAWLPTRPKRSSAHFENWCLRECFRNAVQTGFAESQLLRMFVNSPNFLKNSFLHLGRITDANPFGTKPRNVLCLSGHISDVNRTHSGDKLGKSSTYNYISNTFQRHTPHLVADEPMTPNNSSIGQPIVISPFGDYGPKKR